VVPQFSAQRSYGFVAEQRTQRSCEENGVVLVPGLALQNGGDLADQGKPLGMALAIAGLGLPVAFALKLGRGSAP
jgi:hypothetical protein